MSSLHPAELVELLEWAVLSCSDRDPDSAAELYASLEAEVASLLVSDLPADALWRLVGLMDRLPALQGQVFPLIPVFSRREDLEGLVEALLSHPEYPGFWAGHLELPDPLLNPEEWPISARYRFAANPEVPRGRRMDMLLARSAKGVPLSTVLHATPSRSDVLSMSAAFAGLEPSWQDLEFLSRSADPLVLHEVLMHPNLTAGTVVGVAETLVPLLKTDHPVFMPRNQFFSTLVDFLFSSTLPVFSPELVGDRRFSKPPTLINASSQLPSLVHRFSRLTLEELLAPTASQADPDRLPNSSFALQLEAWCQRRSWFSDEELDVLLAHLSAAPLRFSWLWENMVLPKLSSVQARRVVLAAAAEGVFLNGPNARRHFRDLDVLAEVFPLSELLAWGADAVAAWAGSNGVSFGVLRRLASRFSPEPAAATLIAVLE